jgi:large subunit ribosomal protein L3
MEFESMVTGLWGKKIGMAQIFSGESVVPVTAVDVSGWFVTNIRTLERDGYSAVQVGRVKDRYSNKKFDINWLKKPKQYFSDIREIHLSDGISEETKNTKDTIVIGKPADFLFALVEGESVDVFGKTKGCGFAGVYRRHGFGGAPKTHGSKMGRRTGSLGFMATQGRVIKGKKMPGQMGNRKRVAKNLKVVKIEKDSDIVLVKGSIPGKSGSLVFLRKEKVLG